MCRPSGIVTLDSNGLLIAAIVIIGLVGLGFVVIGGRGSTGKGRAGGLGAVVDQSIGMHIVRSLSGQAPETSEEDVAPAVALTADEVAYRIGIPGADEPERAEGTRTGLGAAAGAALSATAVAGADQEVAPAVALTADEVAYRIGMPGADEPQRMHDDRKGFGAATGAASPTAVAGADPAAAAAAPRRRLMRDAGAALLGLAAVALVAILVVPGIGGYGPSKTFLSVTRAQSTPTSRAATSSTGGPSLALVETPGPTAPPGPTAASRATPTGASPAKPATPKPTPRPTPRPTPTPTPTPKPTPKPTSKATPKPTPTPPLIAKITEAPSCGDALVPLQFAAQSMPGASYDWDFNDGTASGRTTTHAFSGNGTYTVILTVTRSGDTQGDSVVVNVPC